MMATQRSFSFRASSALRSEQGFTLIELMVAVMILTVGLMGLVGTLDGARALTNVSERKEAVVHVAERELEKILALPYSQVRLDSFPVATPEEAADQNHPDFFLRAPLTTGGTPRFQWDRNNASAVEDLKDGGTLAPVSDWTSGALSGRIHRYVTVVRNAAQAEIYRRVTVAVMVNGNENPRRPTIVSAFAVDPSATSEATPSAPVTECVNEVSQLVTCQGAGGGRFTTWHLYDTPSTSNVRVPPANPPVSHPTRATVVKPAGATCTLSNDSGCPKPDLMGLDAPPATPSLPLIDYSNESPLLSQYDGGRLLERDTSDCAQQPSANNLRSHQWVSAPLIAARVLTGRGGVSIWTQALSGAPPGGGTLCVAVYEMAGDISKLTAPGATVPVEIGRSSYSFGSWPTQLAPLSFAFRYRTLAAGSRTVATGKRIAVRMWLSSGSGVERVALVYDDHDQQSIVQLNEEE